MRSRTNLVATVVVAGFAALPMPAAAYVRTVTETGAPTAWDNPNVTIEFSLGSPPPVLSAGGFLDAAQQAGVAWSDASLDGVDRCSSMNLTVESVSDVAGPVGMDYHNRLIFRQGGWCRDPLPADGACYDPSALALTTVFQLRDSGQILDADLEVNATDFTWGDFVGSPELFAYDTQDFQGAITHEFGHVIGLDHTCFSPGETFGDGTLKPRPVDNKGNPVPDCSEGSLLPPTITDATMYVSVDSPRAEVDLRSLSPDDVQGACDIYPVGGGGCSCTAEPGHGFSASLLVLLAMAALLLRRRQRRGTQAGTPPAPGAPGRAR
jgi:MYXO-CTERM domain-containing protein